MEGVSWLCFSSHFRVLGNKRSSLSKGYTSIDHGCEDGLDGIWNEARDQIMKIDSHHEQLFSDRRTRNCDGEDVCRRLLGCTNAVEWSLGRVSGRAGAAQRRVPRARSA